MKRRIVPVSILALLCGLAARDARAGWPPPPTATADDLKDPNNWPNDPGYGYSAKSSGQWNLYGFQPDRAPGAPMLRPDEVGKPSGMSIDMAWRHTIGDPRVVISVLDSGIRWSEADLIDKAYLSLGELKNHKPTTSTGAACGGTGALAGYDCNGDGTLSVFDYKDTTSLTPAASTGHPQGDRNANGVLDAGDLIENFSDGVDDDGNGYVDDISGWDFFKDDNDPFDDNDYGHGTGEAGDSASAANNGISDAGVCPLCRFIPLRVGDSFIADGNDFGQAVVYATDNGVSVIQEALGAIDNPLFAQQALQYAWSHNLLVVASMADENSRHHNPPATNVFTMPVHAIQNDGQNANPTTAKSMLVFNTCTNYGAQNYLSVSGESCSSEATGKGAGVAGLLYSAALKAGVTDLTADEAMQLFLTTADDIDVAESEGPNPTYQWSQKGFDQRFGYGRMNANTAVENLLAGKIPPAAQVTSPRWFENVYPSRVGNQLPIMGYVSAKRAMSYDYVVEWAPGVQPLDEQFKSVAAEVTNIDAATVTGGAGEPLAVIDLTTIDPTQATPDSDSLNGENQYTITIRVSVTAHYGGAIGDVHGELRRAIQVHEDEDLLPGFPIRTDASAESSPKLADIDGDGVRDIVMADSSGRVHVWKATGGALAEVAGFPFKTKQIDGLEDQPASDEPNYRTAPGYVNKGVDLDVAREGFIATLAVDDLDGDGSPEIVGTTWAGTIYAIHHDGTVASGYPVRMPYIPSCPQDPTVTPPAGACMKIDSIITRGAMGSPVLADMNGDSKLDIVQPGFDGKIYAYDGPTGALLNGYPILVHYDGTVAPGPEHNRVITTPTVHDVNGDGVPDILTGSNEKLGVGAAAGAWYLLDGRGTAAPGADPVLGARLTNWPVVVGSIDFLPVVGEGTVDSGAMADFDGDGKMDMVLSGLGNGPYIVPVDPGVQNGIGAMPNGLPVTIDVSGNPEHGLSADFGEQTKVNTSDVFLPVFGQPAIGDLNMDGSPDLVTTGAGLSLAASQANHTAGPAPSGHRLAMWDGKTGDMMPASPVLLEDFTFFNNAAIADLSGDGFPEVITGTGAYLVHAVDGCGREAPGFPKNTGQWVLGSVAIGDVDGDGSLEAVVGTRDGFVYAWHTKGKTDSVIQWESFHHDNRNSGDYSQKLDQGKLTQAVGKFDCSLPNTAAGAAGAAGASGAAGAAGAAGGAAKGGSAGASAAGAKATPATAPQVFDTDGGCNVASNEGSGWALFGVALALRGLRRRQRA